MRKDVLFDELVARDVTAECFDIPEQFSNAGKPVGSFQIAKSIVHFFGPLFHFRDYKVLSRSCPIQVSLRFVPCPFSGLGYGLCVPLNLGSIHLPFAGC
jgi:hypothetical protein